MTDSTPLAWPCGLAVDIDTPKTKAFEVLGVDGGKILDALADEGEGEAIVVGPPAREVPRGEPRPVGVVEGAAVARETDDLPGGMPTKLVTDPDGVGGRQRSAEYGGISQQKVELDQRQFRDGHVIARADRFEVGRGLGVMAFFVSTAGKRMLVSTEITDGECSGFPHPRRRTHAAA